MGEHSVSELCEPSVLRDPDTGVELQCWAVGLTWVVDGRNYATYDTFSDEPTASERAAVVGRIKKKYNLGDPDG